MGMPPGYSQNKDPSLVCKLQKSLYGLKQDSRQWFAKLTESLLHLGFTQSHAAYSMFTLAQNTSFTVALVYVDDILVTGNDPSTIASLKKFLDDQFNIRNLGPLKYYLGIEVSRCLEIAWVV